MEPQTSTTSSTPAAPISTKPTRLEDRPWWQAFITERAARLAATQQRHGQANAQRMSWQQARAARLAARKQQQTQGARA